MFSDRSCSIWRVHARGLFNAFFWVYRAKCHGANIGTRHSKLPARVKIATVALEISRVFLERSCVLK